MHTDKEDTMGKQILNENNEVQTSKEEEKEQRPTFDLGMQIGQDQIDDLEDLQSPPNSPGLVLPVKALSTNDRIDFFALDQSLHNDDSDKISDINQNLKPDSIVTTPLNNKRSASSSKQRILENSVIDSHNDVNLDLLSSSDSYFSRARKNKRETNQQNKQHRNSSRYRRESDVSDRSDGSMSYASGGSFDSGSAGSFYTESDTDITASPSAKYVKRRSMNKAYTSGQDLTHYDDGIVYRTTSNAMSLDSGSITPKSRSRSNSRSRNVSRDRRSSKDDLKDKNGDDSTTAQIFKNTLILEESLRQQYIHQQNLRYKYSMFLFVLVLIFTSSTYYSAFNSIYVDTESLTLAENNRSNKESNINSMNNDFNRIHNVGTSKTHVEDGLGSMSIVPQFTTTIKDIGLVNNGDTNNLADNITKNNMMKDEVSSSIGEESGYILINIIYRVISIITGMTLVLFYLSGEYARTISLPRKFLTTTNKGIRQLNVRLVKVKVPFKERFVGYLRLRLQKSQQGGVDHVRLVLNPRVFSTATREQWELYRNQFWNLEGVRRLQQDKVPKFPK